MNLGTKAVIRLTIEMMGHHSNLFLIESRGLIRFIDCVKRVSLGQNSYVTLQPGASYVMPTNGLKTPFDYSLFELDSFTASIYPEGQVKNAL